MKIVCLGDSFTSGYKMVHGKQWTTLLEEGIGIQVVNKGVHGDTTTGMLSRFYNDIVPEKPNYVIMEGGFNDFLAGAFEGNVQANIMALVHQAYHNHMIPIIILQPYGEIDLFRKYWSDFVDINKIQEKMKKYHQWLVGFCKAFSVFYVDLTDVGNYMDGIHFDEVGHRYVADELIKFFNNWQG